MLTRAPHTPVESARTGQRPHAVVIGSGFGGLAAAIRLGARGYRVTVLERLDQPGGRASVFRQDAFTFDAGPTIITAPFLLEELWSLCGRRLEDDIDLVALSPFYRIRFDDGSKLRGTVFGAEYLGTTQIVTVNTGHGQIKARLPADIRAVEGETVGLALLSERLSLFDRSSGRAIRTAASQGGGRG